MATSIDEVKGFLDEYDLHYKADDAQGLILVGFGCNPEETTYRDSDGDAHVRLIIEVGENGDFLRIFAPFAWMLEGCIHKTAVLASLPALQARHKILRFDYDPTDGELQANVELPLEDASLTSNQFHRAVYTVLHGTQRFDPVIRHAMQTGEVSFEMLDDARERRRAARQLEALVEEAGGNEELERTISGDGPAVDDEEARVAFERMFGIGDDAGSEGGASADGGPAGDAAGEAGGDVDDDTHEDHDGQDGEARKAG